MNCISLWQQGYRVCCHWGWMIMCRGSNLLLIRKFYFFGLHTLGKWPLLKITLNISFAFSEFAANSWWSILVHVDVLYFELGKCSKTSDGLGIIYKAFQLWWPYAAPPACIVWVLFYSMPTLAFGLHIHWGMDMFFLFWPFSCCKATHTLSPSKYRGHVALKLAVVRAMKIYICDIVSFAISWLLGRLGGTTT